jgi:hypothetical protein
MNDRRLNTYLAFADAEALEGAGGRFNLPEHKSTVVGASPVSPYPALPEGNPFASDPVGPEPLIDGSAEGDKLGYRIDGGPDPSPRPNGDGSSDGPTTDTGRPVVRRKGFRRI